MNKINRQGGPQNLSTQQQAQAYRDMESVMKMMEEDRLPGPGVDAVKSSKYADVFSQYEKEHGGAQTEQSKTQTQSTRTKPQSQSQKPKTNTTTTPPSFKTSTPTTSSSDDIDPQFMKDNFSPDAMMKMMEQFAGSQMPGGAPEGAPGGSAPGGDNEMAEMMKKMFGNVRVIYRSIMKSIQKFPISSNLVARPSQNHRTRPHLRRRICATGAR